MAAVRTLAFAVLISGGIAAALAYQGCVQRASERAAATRDAVFENDYTQIEPGLFIGGHVAAPPPGTQAVLNLSLAADSYTAEVYQWSGIPDAAPAPSIEWLQKQVDFVDTQRRAGKQVFIHCDAGISRSGMVVTAYLMARDGRSLEKALQYVRDKRAIRPNPAFLELLGAWETYAKPIKN